jgi:hypothetical protein
MKSTFKASILFVLLLLVTGFMGNTILDIQNKPAGSVRAPLQDTPTVVTETKPAVTTPTKTPEKQRPNIVTNGGSNPTVATPPPVPAVVIPPQPTAAAPSVVTPKSSTKTRSS